MVKVTLEFRTTDEAIVALGKLVEAPQAAQIAHKAAVADDAAPAAPGASTTRRQRADKGQPRGPYRERAAKAIAGDAPAEPAPAAEGPASSAPAEQPAAPAVATEPEAPATPTAAGKPETTGASKAEKESTNSTPTTSAPVPVASATAADVQKALEAVFNTQGLGNARALLADFGVERARDIKPEKYDAFIAAAQAKLKATAA